MPKLYYQKGAWEIPGQQDRHATRVDVPNSPAELAAWLNARNVQAITGDVAELARERDLQRSIDVEADQRHHEDPLGLELERPRSSRVPGFCDACGQSSAGKLKLSQGADVETVAAWMMGAEGWQLRRIAETLAELKSGAQ